LGLIVSDAFLQSAWWRISLGGALLESKPLDRASYRELFVGLRPFVLSAGNAKPLAGRFVDVGDAPRTIAFANENQQMPAVASDGNRALIVWSELQQGGGYWTTMAVLAGRDGRPLGAPFRLFDTSFFGHEMAAVFDGKEYFVVHE